MYHTQNIVIRSFISLETKIYEQLTTLSLHKYLSVIITQHNFFHSK